MDHLSFKLEPVPPFRLDLTAWALRRRPHNIVDRWDGQTYRRVFLINGRAVDVAVTQTGPPAHPELEVQALGLPSGPDSESTLSTMVAQMLGTDTDLAEFHHLARQDEQLRPLVEQFRGVKPPRFPTVFEALANGIACQQLSLTVGIHLLNRLASNWGLKFPASEPAAFAFPRPQDLAGVTPEDLRQLGFSRQKGRYLLDLASQTTQGRLDLGNLASLDDEAALKFLSQIRGVGRWTAEYVLLRGLGRWHLFPGDDVGARQKLQNFLHLTEPLDYQGVRRVLERWHPYAGLIYFHFLLSGLAEEGHLT